MGLHRWLAIALRPSCPAAYWLRGRLSPRYRNTVRSHGTVTVRTKPRSALSLVWYSALNWHVFDHLFDCCRMFFSLKTNTRRQVWLHYIRNQFKVRVCNSFGQCTIYRLNWNFKLKETIAITFLARPNHDVAYSEWLCGWCVHKFHLMMMCTTTVPTLV